MIIANRVPGAAAILAYGSCIRDTAIDESLIDLYVLTRRFDEVSNKLLSRFACRVLPPNVYYAECMHAGRRLRSKFAVMTLSDFARRTTNVQNPYFWARFAQPSRLVFAAEEVSRSTVLKAIVEATMICLYEAGKLAKPGEDILSALTRTLKASYATELRAEKQGRAEMLVALSREYYSDLVGLVPLTTERLNIAAERQWRTRQTIGKALSVARLIKAGFTFEGGADYMAWKIGRHSGEVLTMNSWQRRHPVLTGLLLLPKLLRKGAVR
jgi:hypothetical protein